MLYGMTTKRYCTTCKTTNEPLMIACRNGEKIYFRCRKCNTARMKRYASTKIGREHIRLNNKKSYHKNIIKCKARGYFHLKVPRLYAEGKLTDKICSVCGSVLNVQAHHPDYSKPLEVIWLCTPCHADEHRNMLAQATSS